MDGASFNRLLIQVLNLKDNNSQYQKSFGELVNEAIENKKWKQKDIVEHSNICRKTFTDINNGHIPKKSNVVLICVVLGLDLIETMLFMLQAGYIFNPIAIELDRIYMQYIDEPKSEREKRTLLLNFYEYIEKECFKTCKCADKDNVESQKEKCINCRYVKYCDTYKKYNNFILD